MQQLITSLKGHFPKAEIRWLEQFMIEVDFEKAKESVIIQQQKEEGRYTVSYPKLVVDKTRGIRHEEITTSSNILLAGVHWILKQVQKHGKVLPEFY